MNNRAAMTIDPAGFLRSIRHDAKPVHTLLKELVDNAIDAGAKKVAFREDGDNLVIEDDGKGFPDLYREAFKYGDSQKTKSIGRYGVGMTQCALSLSDATTIESNGKAVRNDWAALESGHRDIADPPDMFTTDFTSGTRITLENYRERFGNRRLHKEDIKLAFSEMISEKRLEITWNGVRWDYFPKPRYNKGDQIDESFTFMKKRVRVVGGVYKPNDARGRKWSGYNVFWKGRLIAGNQKKNGVGTGEDVGTCWAFDVFLEDRGKERWNLSTNKDSIPEIPALLDRIYQDYTADLLKKSKDQQVEIEDAAFCTTITKILNGHGGQVGNQTRTKKGGKGSKQPTGTGTKKTRTFTATRAGRYYDPTGNRHKTGYSVTMSAMGADRGPGCVNELGSTLQVTLNSDDPCLGTMLTDTTANWLPILGLVKMLATWHAETKGSTLIQEDVVAHMNRVMENAVFPPGEIPDVLGK